jgi:hypothetical protein
MEQRRTIVGAVTPTAGSERRACRWLGFHRSAVRYAPAHREDDALRTHYAGDCARWRSSIRGGAPRC